MTRVSAHEVARYVAARHRLTFADLCSQRRTRDYARPRQIAMHAIRRLCPHMSYPAIGRMLGGRDHTTALHGDRKISDLVEVDEDIRLTVKATIDHFEMARVDFTVLCADYSAALRSGAAA